MRRQVLYSGSRRTPGAASSAPRPATGAPAPESARAPLPGRSPRFARVRTLGTRHAGLLRFLGGAACAALIGGAYLWSQPRPRALGQEDIDAAVLHTLENKTLPSRPAKAADIVRPSVVRVRGFGEPPPSKGKAKSKSKRRDRKSGKGTPGDSQAKGKDDPNAMEELSVGSGVVIVDDGVILTNLHVVAGAKRVTVTFHDGSESDADLVSVHPENDLAVIKAQKIPDDLPAATLGSAGQLKPGDEVVAVGFPFGMGPSVSSGVVSGLNREFRSPEGDRLLTQLIQFDAAANPGSSGGPLVTMQGDVVGIVTAILNPTESRTFIGIGFAVTIAAAGRAVGIHPF
ncbi:MAG: S1C family serine protease [Betaproteobacteria bacterium]|nr:S1C family serine protease [Betaproteobacteria bacterium]MDH3437359.1 S1C family serine protease [Betaproteobacteria bacterium]